MNDVFFEKDTVYIKNVKNFDLAQTLDCGQAFRWKADGNGVWSGIAGGRYIELELYPLTFDEYLQMKAFYGKPVEADLAAADFHIQLSGGGLACGSC